VHIVAVLCRGWSHVAVLAFLYIVRDAVLCLSLITDGP